MIPPKLRAEAMEWWFRGGFRRCVICNKSGNIHLHHVYTDHDPYTDTKKEDLIPVCPVCHRKLEYFPDSNLNRLSRIILREKIECTSK